MTIKEKELFSQVLESFKDEFPSVEVAQPYNDGYLEFSVNGKSLGGFNVEGHNLLYCLSELTKVYEFELL